MLPLPALVRRHWAAALEAGVAGPGPLVVGVSGGVDSLALLHLLRGLAPALGVTLRAATLDHGIRGPAGAADAAFVAALCAEWGVPCAHGACDTPAYAAREGRSLEDAARRMRYTFLAAVAAEAGASAVAVGHQADDQVETTLDHWLRGAGLAGLAGMAPWAPLPLPPDAPDLARALGLPAPPAAPWLLRPLLDVWRADLAAYCAAEGLQPREDATNADPTYRRNYLRAILLPLLEQAQPGLRARLHRSATIFRDEDALLEADLDAAWPSLATPTGDVVRLDLAAFAALPPSLQRRAIRRAAATLGALPGLDLVHIEAARTLLGPAGRTGAVTHWPSGGRVWRERGAGLVAAGGAARDAAWPCLAPGAELLPPPEGEMRVGAFLLRVSRADDATGGGPRGDAWTAVFDADALAALGPLTLRTRRPGDRIRPQGAGGRSRKLQDVLVDGGVPRHVRPGLALLATGDGVVLWAPGPGGRRGDAALVGPATRRIVTFTFRRAPEEASCTHVV
jgi:tRNA(Ile)-lysidine synthetase-like protein